MGATSESYISTQLRRLYTGFAAVYLHILILICIRADDNVLFYTITHWFSGRNCPEASAGAHRCPSAFAVHGRDLVSTSSRV